MAQFTPADAQLFKRLLADERARLDDALSNREVDSRDPTDPMVGLATDIATTISSRKGDGRTSHHGLVTIFTRLLTNEAQRLTARIEATADDGQNEALAAERDLIRATIERHS